MMGVGASLRYEHEGSITNGNGYALHTYHSTPRHRIAPSSPKPAPLTKAVIIFLPTIDRYIISME
jgi:hypothetical protein